MRFSLDALNSLSNYSWPGNVRELENEVKRASIMTEGDIIGITDISEHVRNPIDRGSGGNDIVDGPQSLHPNFSFGGDTTAASDSIASAAVGLVPHQSLFGGNGVNLPDTPPTLAAT